MDNMYRYQGAYSEWEEETGWNDFELRTYDLQIGRWTGVDPYDQFASGYIGMGNNPVNFVDPDGGCADCVEVFVRTTVKHSGSFLNSAMKVVNVLGPVMYNYVNDQGHTFQSPNPQSDVGAVIFNGQEYKYTGTSQDVYKETVALEKGNNWVDGAQMGLDGVGMTEIPFVSQGAELISAGISFGRGDVSGGLIGLGSMIPIGGKVFEGMKVARRIQKHHIIPNAVYKAFKSDLKAMGWSQNHLKNFKKLPVPFHRNHPAYNTEVANRLRNIIDAGGGLQDVINLQRSLRYEINDIMKQGYSKLNSYYK